MSGLWNLQTKIVLVLVIILLGSLGVQAYVHRRAGQKLQTRIIELTEDVANRVTRLFVRIKVRSQDGQGRQGRSPGIPISKPWKAKGKEIVLNQKMLEEMDRDLAKNPSEQVGKDNAAGQTKKSWRPRALHSEPDSSRPILNDVMLEEIDAASRSLFLQFEVVPVAAGSSNPTNLIPSARELDGSGLSARDLIAGRVGAEESKIKVGKHGEQIQHIFDEYGASDLIATLGIFLLGIGLAWFLGMRMTRPIYKVVEGFNKVSQGDFSVKLPEKKGGEFALLGRQFNEMVSSLAKNRQLEQELEQRERVQHMGDLAAGVAHDVRNPLNAIYLNIGQIRDEFCPEDPASAERFDRFTSVVQTEVERLNQLVSNFLSLAQPVEEEKLSLNLGETLVDLVGLLKKEAAERNVELELVNDAPDTRVLCNLQEIKNAFLNVSMNALQALETKSGGNLRVHCHLVNDPDSGAEDYCVDFEDNGIGIAEDDLKKIFVPYFTTRSGGTGLGMSIARRIAERNGASMQLRSEQGEGTQVRFAFRLNEGSALLLDADPEIEGAEENV